MCGGMRITADNGHSRLGKSLFWPDDVDDSLANIFHGEIGHAKLGCITGQHFDLNTRFLVGNSGRTVCGRDIVVRHCKRAVRRTHRAAGIAQPFKGLWTGHFMNKVPVNIDQTGAIILAMHNMRIPDFVKKGLWCRHPVLQKSAGEGLPCR